MTAPVIQATRASEERDADVPGARTALVFITLVLFFNYLDRYLLGILITPIKAEFNLTDSQIGLMLGLAFALFYSGLAIPIARFADRLNRVRLLAVSAAVWSLALAACGFAANFYHLLLGRMGLGCGEAGGLPPAHSMVGDYFAPGRRATAMSFVALAGSGGVAAAPLVGGALNELFGWRGTFIVVAIPGLVLAVLLPFCMREPRRGESDGLMSVSRPPQHMGRVIKELWGRLAFRHLALALTFSSLTEYALFLWTGPLFGRALHLPSDVLGLQIFLYQGIPYMVGTLAGGVIADRLYRRDKRWMSWMPALAMTVVAPAALGLCFSEGRLILAMIIVPSLMLGLYVAPAFAAIQGLASVQTRATAIAFLVFLENVVGAGLGPWLIGVLSDVLHARFGEESLRYSMLSLVVLFLGSAGLFFRMGRHLERGLAEALEASKVERSAGTG